MTVEFTRVQEDSWQWSVYLNILEVRADSGFYRGLLKLQCIHSATSSWGYTVLQAQLYLGCVYVGFRCGHARVYTRHDTSRFGRL